MTGVIEKWVEAEPAERIGDVAARTLQGRLDAVRYYLSLAADKADQDREHVHQLRVWVRRATAALRLYEPLLPRRRFCWMRQQLKRVRRSANDARDCDVLLERLKKRTGHAVKRWLETVRAERAEAQKVIVAVHERLGRDGRFARRIDRLVQRVRERGSNSSATAPPFGDWAREQLRPVVERFFGAVPTDRRDEAALHQFRIRGKELRYVLELLAAAFSERDRTELYPAVEAIQDRLGEINDLATAKSRLQQKNDSAGDRADAASWRCLLTKEAARLDRARQSFWHWCAPEMLQKLHSGFEAGHHTPPANTPPVP